MTDFSITESPLDQKRFGIRTAKAILIMPEDVEKAEAFCEENKIQMTIARVPSPQLDTVQKMEAVGFRLMDTLVYYAFKFNKNETPEDTSGHHLRLSKAADSEAVAMMAKSSFQGYFGHYHADSRLDNDQCDAVYIEWAEKSVTQPDFADAVYVVEGDPDLKGFATLRQNSAEEGEGVLFGVAPHAQGQGIYRSLMIQGMNWCAERETQRMVVSTQITNVAVQKVWARLGFEFDRAYYTFHKWYDE